MNNQPKPVFTNTKVQMNNNGNIGFVIALILIVAIGIVIAGFKFGFIGKADNNLYWDHFKEMSYLGDVYIDVLDENDLEWLTSEDFDSYWQSYTELKWYDEVCELKDSEISYGIAWHEHEYSGGLTCETIGGTANELFGITEAIDIDTFMNCLDVGIGDEPYAIITSSEGLYNCWWSMKQNDTYRDEDADKYEYMIKVYSKGIREAYNEDISGNDFIVSDELPDSYYGYDDDYNIVYPETRVTVTLIPYGQGI